MRLLPRLEGKQKSYVIIAQVIVSHSLKTVMQGVGKMVLVSLLS